MGVGAGEGVAEGHFWWIYDVIVRIVLCDVVFVCSGGDNLWWGLGFGGGVVGMGRGMGGIHRDRGVEWEGAMGVMYESFGTGDGNGKGNGTRAENSVMNQ